MLDSDTDVLKIEVTVVGNEDGGELSELAVECPPGGVEEVISVLVARVDVTPSFTITVSVDV